MTRSPLLTLLIVLLSLLLRAAVPPVYVGKPADDPPLPQLPLAQPFGDDLKGASDAFLSLQAKSILDNGLAATGGFPLFNVGKVETRDFAWYDHHPPGVALVTAAAFHFFGASELVARCVALLFSTITLALLVDLVRRELGGAAAWVTAAGALASPMGCYWATQLDYQVPAIAASTLFLIAALRVPTRGRDVVVAGLALVLALSFDFLAIFAIVALFLERLMTGPRSLRQLFGWPIFAGFVGAALIGWKFWATGRYGHPLGGTLQQQIAEVWNLPEGVDPIAWIKAVGWNAWSVTGPLPVLALAAALLGIVAGEKSSVPLKRMFRASFLLALFAGLAPRARAYDHPYFELWLLLPVALSFALTAGTWLVTGEENEPKRTDGPARIVALIAVVVIFAVGLGFTVWDRRPASEEIPSAHRLGRELAAAKPAAAVFALPAASRFIEFVPNWYAHRIVLRLPEGNESRDGIKDVLATLGLSDAEIWLAEPAQWPGRGGFRPLPPLDPKQPVKPR
jgi:4-amino-4-deoxy-L-arabinose transferase-like glycosyltransferase